MENVDNKTPEATPEPVAEAPLPNLPQEDVKKEPADPEYEKWVKDTATMENAYKRVKGSASEVEKWRKQAEELEKVKSQHDQITQELQILAQRDPELVERINKTLLGETESDNKETTVDLPPEDRKLLDNLRARETHNAIGTINKFRDSFKDYIQNEEQWDVIREHAKSLDGKRDIKGNPYTLETALQAAIRAEMPEVVSDQAALRAYAASVNRDSAAEPGDTSSGRSSEASLSPEEEAMIRRFSKWGATREGYLARKTQPS